MVKEMMRNGMAIDVPYLRGLSDYYAEGMVKAAEEAARIVGHAFNPSSTQQVAKVVYEELGFPVTKSTPSGGASTDDRELKKINHPVIASILEYRRLSKNKGTYADGIPDRAVLHDDGVYRVHTTLKVTRTETGRLSSADPNLQNIPTRSEEGKKIKKGFIATP
jgi:DNA polymerase-1